MFNLRNWKYTRHKSLLHALMGVLAFVLIIAPVVYRDIDAKEQQIPVSEEEQQEDETAEVVEIDTVSKGNAGVQDAEVLNLNVIVLTDRAASEIEETAEQALLALRDRFAVVRRKEVTYETVKFQTEYVDNPVWTSDREELLQEGADGEREITEIVAYRGDGEIAERVLLNEEVIAEAVPAVIERGTKEPAEYIRPMDAGRFSSGFGMRWGRMHKGVDWSVEVGTRVNAAKDGTVSFSGEQNGYGYVVYIDHEDGTQTRYAHLSELLCEEGDEVLQADQIALSGNTGRSTGPHLHFEILIDGEQINPLDKLD